MAPLLTRKAGRLKAFYISNKTDKHKYYYGHNKTVNFAKYEGGRVFHGGRSRIIGCALGCREP